MFSSISEFPDLYECAVLPVIVFGWWQLFYVLKTELIDRRFLNDDPDMITSARYLVFDICIFVFVYLYI